MKNGKELCSLFLEVKFCSILNIDFFIHLFCYETLSSYLWRVLSNGTFLIFCTKDCQKWQRFYHTILVGKLFSKTEPQCYQWFSKKVWKTREYEQLCHSKVGTDFVSSKIIRIIRGMSSWDVHIYPCLFSPEILSALAKIMQKNASDKSGFQVPQLINAEWIITQRP